MGGVILILMNMTLIINTMLTYVGGLASNPVTRGTTRDLTTNVGDIVNARSLRITRPRRIGRRFNNGRFAFVLRGYSSGDNGRLNTTMRDAANNFNNSLGILMNFSARNGVVNCAVLRTSRAPNLNTGTAA